VELQEESEVRAVVLAPGAGTVRADPLGHAIVRKASGEETHGAYSVTESTRPVGLGAPSHDHAEHEEAFYVLEGNLRFDVSGSEVSASAGSFVLVPRGVTHSFSIVGDSPARYLCIFSPPATPEEGRRLSEFVQRAKTEGLIT
jgi:quercetin dioxygenase-like cupin family protein